TFALGAIQSRAPIVAEPSSSAAGGVHSTQGIATLGTDHQALEHTGFDGVPRRKLFVELQPLLRQFERFFTHQGRHRDFDPLFSGTLPLGRAATDREPVLSPRPRSPL